MIMLVHNMHLIAARSCIMSTFMFYFPKAPKWIERITKEYIRERFEVPPIIGRTFKKIVFKVIQHASTENPHLIPNTYSRDLVTLSRFWSETRIIVFSWLLYNNSTDLYFSLLAWAAQPGLKSYNQPTLWTPAGCLVVYKKTSSRLVSRFSNISLSKIWHLVWALKLIVYELSCNDEPDSFFDSALQKRVFRIGKGLVSTSLKRFFKF